jgi:predicted nuclease of predicted toxin-antitoxin system
MKVLLDQGLPRAATVLLVNLGIDAIHVGQIGMAEAADIEILERGRHEQRIVVTLDADFHAHLALSGASSPSVIRLRLEGLRAEGLATILEQLLVEWEEELEVGAVVTVDAKRTRMRRLPLVAQNRT